MKRLIFIIITLFFSLSINAQSDEKKAASDQLGKALEYFTSNKYHEALLLFEKLSGKYRLNPRYMAFMGTCYYYEWKYQEAIECFDKAIPELGNFSPHERSFYIWANAESHFNLGRYEESVPLYHNMLALCYENEKPDAYYRLGFCHYFKEDNQKAHDYFVLALSLYEKYRPEMTARIVQLRNMINGFEK